LGNNNFNKSVLSKINTEKLKADCGNCFDAELRDAGIERYKLYHFFILYISTMYDWAVA